MDPITIHDVRAMSKEELAALNRTLHRKIAIHMALFVGLKVGTMLAIRSLAKHLDKKYN